jgi:hypothetical protein
MECLITQFYHNYHYYHLYSPGHRSETPKSTAKDNKRLIF